MAKRVYTRNSAKSASSKFGQMIGESFEREVIKSIRKHLQEKHDDYELLERSQQKGNIVSLTMLGGSKRQLDTVIMSKDSDDPAALLETKWLKDARHHNDKGAWILQLREVQRKYATVRGAAAILAGYWTEGVAVVLMSEGGIRMVLVTTDEEVYSTLQKSLDDFLGKKSFKLDAPLMRKSYPQPWDLANFLINLQEKNKLNTIAASWLQFEREKRSDGTIVTGEDKIKEAIDELLGPLPKEPNIKSFEITLQIDTGNLICEKFDDVEAALAFIQNYFGNSKEILERITPRKKPKRLDE